MAEDGYKVILNIYDLSQGLARQLSTTFLGKAIEAIWHTGVVVYGTEYYFGGGIQKDPAGTTPYGTPMRVVDLGITHLPKDVFEQYLEEISPRYTAETYSLLHHNCNNFSNEVAQFLVGTTIPDYILQLPNEVMSSPMGALILPMIQRLETTLRSNSVPQVPQFVPTATPPTSQGAFVNTTSGTPTTVSKREAKREMNVTSPKENNTLSSDHTKDGEKPSLGSREGISPKKADAPKSDYARKSGESSSEVTLEARKRVQEEITSEFTALMAAGNLRASEAAALATRKVMQRYGMHNASAFPQS